MKDLLWLIPLLPFVGTLLNGVVLRNRIGKRAVTWIACGTVGLSALLAVAAVAAYLGSPEHGAHRPWEQEVYLWVPAGELSAEAPAALADVSISMGFLLDPLSAVMILVVTFVGFWIHVYSVGYMGHDEGFQRYFTYLNLFMGAMLLLVLGNGYLVMFVGWEGVGLCSYLLIGFYFKEDFPPYAGRKAFIINRIGDFAFLVGLFALVSTFGTLRYTELFPAIAASRDLATADYHLGLTFAGFVTLALFIGAMGKSAQIPLYVWLPDAMAGPTPVSALIHAATMVTAGVYMVARSNVLYQLAPGVSLFVAGIGCATALMAATIAVAQNDIKKVLAYSTVSQLGYMFLGAGVGAYTASIFHLGTHAFFKALLFLGSGSVIHAMGGAQDMRGMGGLKRHMPSTYWTFLIATLAIAGFPLLSGFFSKDAILHAAASEGHWVLYGVGLATAALTAFYMFRAVFLTFHGDFRGSEEQRHHLHESPPVMTLPLWVLAVGSVAAGWVGIPAVLTFWRLDLNLFDRFLEPALMEVPGLAGASGHGGEHGLGHGAEWVLVGLAVAVFALGWLAARKVFGDDRGLAGDEAFAVRAPGLQRLLANKYYVDEAYDATVVRGFWASCRAAFRFDASVIDGFFVNGSAFMTRTFALISGFFDKYFVDGLVNAVAWVLQRSSRGFRRLQTGSVSQYAFVLALGVLSVICLYLLL